MISVVHRIWTTLYQHKYIKYEHKKENIWRKKKNMEEEGMEGREHVCEQKLGGICLSEDVTKKSIILYLIKKIKKKACLHNSLFINSTRTSSDSGTLVVAETLITQLKPQG